MAVSILVSACLLGTRCRYDGSHKLHEKVSALRRNPNVKLIPICPEVLGGLTIPHEPSEQKEGRVISRDGRDVTEEFILGAQKALEIATRHDCRYAILKERSPSCGKGEIYDGSFTGKLVPGNGVSAALLMQHGVKVYGESELDELIAELGLSV